MTEHGAIVRAEEYIKAKSIDVGTIKGVKHFSREQIEAMAAACPPDLVDTYQSVLKSFRNHWLVTFEKKIVAGQVVCPHTKLICVFENGEVSLFPSP